MVIGKIVKSDSHINYICQIYAPGEVQQVPRPADYAFGQFVRARVRTHDDHARDSGAQPGRETWAVGVIYDTILLNPTFGTLGPRLSNDVQIEMFSPDYLAERAVLVYLLVLGLINADGTIRHGIPPVALELGCEVETLSPPEVRQFHYFADHGTPGGQRPYLHMGYLPHMLAQRNILLPMVTLRIIDQLETLFPKHQALLSIVKQNFSWRLKVEAAG
jgi:hypothetical protein